MTKRGSRALPGALVCTVACMVACTVACMVGCDRPASAPEALPEPPDGMLALRGGTAHLGDPAGEPGTMPARVEAIHTFFLDRAPVSVAAFRAFAQASGHVTTAERLGGSVFELGTGRWRIVEGATYARPLGPDAPSARDDEPATQVSWDDASAFCAARSARLPTEAEWEHAARNARDDRGPYPWGEELRDARGHLRANVWQGAFPAANTLEDGYLFASPIGAFPPTPLGLVDLIGNAWQWTSTALEDGQRVMRGGSFLCDPHVCHGYRVWARQSATPDSALMHVGFRCAADAPRG